MVTPYKRGTSLIALLLLIALMLVAFNASAADSRVLDNVASKFQSAASSWAGPITTAATRLFFSLAAISLAWTFSLMALRKADIGEFFAEFARFSIFTGFYYWLLTNGSSFANAIIKSLTQLGSQASGGISATPSGILDVAFKIFSVMLEKSGQLDIPERIAGVLVAIVILGMLALVAVNMTVVIVSGWILAYAGIFFLGFGGARWTSDMAISYYKSVLGVGASLMSMMLLAAIGKSFIEDYYSQIGNVTFQDMSVVLVAALVLLVLVNKVPAILAALSGGATGAATSGHFGAATLAGAAAVGAAALAGAGKAVASGALNAAAGMSAVKNAMQAAGEARAAGGGGSTSGQGEGSQLSDAMGGDAGSTGSSAGGSSGGEGGGGAGEGSGSEGGQGGGSGGGASEGGGGVAEPSQGKGSGGQSGPGSKTAAGQIFNAVGRLAKARASTAMGKTAMGKLANEIKAPSAEGVAEVAEMADRQDSRAGAKESALGDVSTPDAEAVAEIDDFVNRKST